jgi:hypothetical protein
LERGPLHVQALLHRRIQAGLVVLPELLGGAEQAVLIAVTRAVEVLGHARIDLVLHGGRGVLAAIDGAGNAADDPGQVLSTAHEVRRALDAVEQARAERRIGREVGQALGSGGIQDRVIGARLSA